MAEKSRWKRFFNWVKFRRDIIFHWVVLIALTIYVRMNWEACISMQFFSQFDGNNILFIVWIILIFLMLYDIEAKDIKLRKHKLKEELENADMLHSINSISSGFIGSSIPVNQHEKEATQDESPD